MIDAQQDHRKGKDTIETTANQKEVTWADTENSKGTGKTATAPKTLTPSRQEDTEKESINLTPSGSAKHGTSPIEDTTSTGSQEQKPGPLGGGSHGHIL